MTAEGADPLAMLAPEAELGGEELKGCCAAAYGHPAVRWLLGGELHPGGEETTRRALCMAGAGEGDRLLDVASGTGASALLAAREFGVQAVGVEYGAEAVEQARAAASDTGLERRASFLAGDAEALPVGDGCFDLVLCECSLCTFPDKQRAVAEIRRVLRPGGRLALSDVVVDAEHLPERLRGAAATVACVGSALSEAGYRQLLSRGGLRVETSETRDEDADRLARRVEERLRGARLLGIGPVSGAPFGIEEAIELARMARRAISEGALSYAIFVAVA
jgi:arsenite methyltransferase